MEAESAPEDHEPITPGTAAGAPELVETTHEPRVPMRLVALKHGDTFMVADFNGDVLGEGDGLFHNDTRLLSRWRLTVGGKAPVLLSSSLSQDNVIFTTNLTNRPLPPLGAQSLREGVIHIERKRLINADRMYERITFTNFSMSATEVPFALDFSADFRDMFEVRGVDPSWELLTGDDKGKRAYSVTVAVERASSAATITGAAAASSASDARAAARTDGQRSFVAERPSASTASSTFPARSCSSRSIASPRRTSSARCR
jgi:glycogen debranching enzyme